MVGCFDLFGGFLKEWLKGFAFILSILQLSTTQVATQKAFDENIYRQIF